MIKVPCDKCLLLAACRHRDVLNCEQLYRWTERYMDQNKFVFLAALDFLTEVISKFEVVTTNKNEYFRVVRDNDDPTLIYAFTLNTNSKIKHVSVIDRFEEL